MANPRCPRCPTSTLTPAEGDRLRELVKQHGGREAARMVGLSSPTTLFKAAALFPVSRMAATVIRDRLDVVAPSPAPACPVVEVPAVVALPPAPPKTREKPAKLDEPSEPDGVARWRTVTRAGDELAEFSLRVDADRAFRVDARAVAVVEVATGEVVLERPRRKLG